MQCNASCAPDEQMEPFIEGIVGSSFRKVAEDLGEGFVRLSPQEADRRQAVQDIRSVESILLELLRNARDADAHRIYTATHRSGNLREIVVIDDGSGIPQSMVQRVFEPHVTSKLDSVHLDRWGIHGRGMALYSIRENSSLSEIAFTRKGCGTSFRVEVDLSEIPEKKDQSAFPRFEDVDGTYIMRGPKNILRTCAEFALENRSKIDVFCGSFTEIASTIYKHGIDTVAPTKRLFSSTDSGLRIDQLLCLCSDESQFANLSAEIGIPLSERSARRILDGDIGPLPTILSRIEAESIPGSDPTVRSTAIPGKRRRSDDWAYANPANRKISREDLAILGKRVHEAFSELSPKYYLSDVDPVVEQKDGRIHISIDMVDLEDN